MASISPKLLIGLGAILLLEITGTYTANGKKQPSKIDGKNQQDAESVKSGCDINEDRIREIVQDELKKGQTNSFIVPPAIINDTQPEAALRSIVLTDDQGREFDYNENDAAYRADIPSTMCSASILAHSTASNQVAFVSAHSALRTQLNNCKWKLPIPSPPLATCISSTAMAAQANTWSQTLKTQDGCKMKHSSQSQRTVTFQLDNGTQVTSAYTGENLAWISLCLTTGDTNNFNKYQTKFCASGYFYNDSSHAWWGEVTSYVNANGGNFVNASQLNTLNSNGATQVGHWTQMAWASSTVLGAATAECSTVKAVVYNCSPPGVGGCGADGKKTINSRCFSWVTTGRYYKGGNYVGQNPYTSTGSLCTVSG